MLLTKESDYAFQVIRALKNGEKRTVKDICSEESLPEPFVYRILKKMEKAGIVKSKRGVQGGYFLDTELDELKLMDVINAIDSDFGISEWTKKKNANKRAGAETICKVQEELHRVQGELISELQRHSMAEILG